DGCPYAPRCNYVLPACRGSRIALRDPGDGHVARCIRLEEIERLPTPGSELTPARGGKGVLLEVSDVWCAYGGGSGPAVKGPRLVAQPAAHDPRHRRAADPPLPRRRAAVARTRGRARAARRRQAAARHPLPLPGGALGRPAPARRARARVRREALGAFVRRGDVGRRRLGAGDGPGDGADERGLAGSNSSGRGRPTRAPARTSRRRTRRAGSRRRRRPRRCSATRATTDSATGRRLSAASWWRSARTARSASASLT